jgi:hypothetical protein
MTVVPGYYERNLPIGIQWGHVIDAIRKGAQVLEPHGLVMVLEPLSDNPDLFLRTPDEGFALCRAVNSPACKVLCDMYHVQRNQGRMIEHIDWAWDEIGYFQIGDVPGRNEPGTGEMNYRNIFKHIAGKAQASGKISCWAWNTATSCRGPRHPVHRRRRRQLLSDVQWRDDPHTRVTAGASQQDGRHDRRGRLARAGADAADHRAHVTGRREGPPDHREPRREEDRHAAARTAAHQRDSPGTPHAAREQHAGVEDRGIRRRQSGTPCATPA